MVVDLIQYQGFNLNLDPDTYRCRIWLFPTRKRVTISTSILLRAPLNPAPLVQNISCLVNQKFSLLLTVYVIVLTKWHIFHLIAITSQLKHSIYYFKRRVSFLGETFVFKCFIFCTFVCNIRVNRQRPRFKSSGGFCSLCKALINGIWCHMNIHNMSPVIFYVCWAKKHALNILQKSMEHWLCVAKLQ